MNNYKFMAVLMWLLFLILAIFGWWSNIFSLFAIDDIFTGEGTLRLIGVVLFPLGAVLGYF